MRPIKGPDGITIDVPRNFPQPTLKEEKDLKILSFNLFLHKDSKRFVHFFEFLISSTTVDFLKRLPQEGYQIGKNEKEVIVINGQDASLHTFALEITHPCGSKEKVKLYALEYHCAIKNKYTYILTFTMTKKGFVEIVKTLRCH